MKRQIFNTQFTIFEEKKFSYPRRDNELHFENFKVKNARRYYRKHANTCYKPAILLLSFRCERPVKNGEHIYVTKKNILSSVVVNEFETAAMECTAQGSPVPR
jgi:hypothetical protein